MEGPAAATPRAFFGLGTNVGDRGENLRRALAGLSGLVALDAVSSVYRSEPVGHADQPDFWNMVVAGRAESDPWRLLERTQTLETELGRVRSFPNAPRTIDIDLLLFGGSRIDTVGLRVPHPRLLERAFVLRPLAEIAADLRVPGSDRTVAQHWAEAEGLERTWRILGPEELVVGDPALSELVGDVIGIRPRPAGG